MSFSSKVWACVWIVSALYAGPASAAEISGSGRKGGRRPMAGERAATPATVAGRATSATAASARGPGAASSVASEIRIAIDKVIAIDQSPFITSRTAPTAPSLRTA